MGNGGRDEFLRKMKILSMIKGRLNSLDMDPGIVEKVMMDEFDGKKEPVISNMMKDLDPDDKKGFQDLMDKVLERI